MSSSDVMEELLCYKNDIEKDLKVCFYNKFFLIG